jgi:hypothetical protein
MVAGELKALRRNRNGDRRMLGRWRQAGWIAAFACIVFGFGFEVLHASKQTRAPHYGYHSSQSQKKDNPASNKDDAHKSLWERTWEDPVAFFTLWLAIFTFVLAASTIGLWIATILTLRHSRETAERQLRAYVLPSGAEILNMVVGSTPLARVEIKNFGQTPAYDLTHIHGFAFLNWPLDEELPPPKSPIQTSRTFLGPGGTGTGVRPADRIFSAGANDDVINRTMAFYVYGEIIYKDAFGRRRTTQYRYFHTGIPGMGPGNLITHQDGNKAD